MIAMDEGIEGLRGSVGRRESTRDLRLNRLSHGFLIAFVRKSCRRGLRLVLNRESKIRGKRVGNDRRTQLATNRVVVVAVQSNGHFIAVQIRTEVRKERQ
jgi:hypothetical protein